MRGTSKCTYLCAHSCCTYTCAHTPACMRAHGHSHTVQGPGAAREDLPQDFLGALSHWTQTQHRGWTVGPGGCWGADSRGRSGPEVWWGREAGRSVGWVWLRGAAILPLLPAPSRLGADTANTRSFVSCEFQRNNNFPGLVYPMQYSGRAFTKKSFLVSLEFKWNRASVVYLATG